ncbi:MAG: hypothetical protein JW958_06945 [Candidatus Eisenbacteria bacterium]|nr:hypothetical protein [Candidatus Eisenbacteria bacterium]
MIVPINHAKLAIPPGPASYLPRRRLDPLWPEWADKTLVLVTAGAGFGKTSFLSAAARSSERPVVWYSIDETDAGLGRFCAHLHAAFSAKPKESLTLPEGGDADFANRVLAHMVRALSKEKGGKVLVLDDVHMVARSGPVMRLLERMIRFLPPGSTLVLASREPLPIATMKLQSLGAVARLTSDELEFDAEEAARLYRLHFPDARLDPAVGDRIVARTEGWPAGIEILFQSLGRPSNRAIEGTLGRMAEEGRGWFAFFAEEVLRALEPELCGFLIRTSVLPRLEADLCDRILGEKNSRRFLEELSRRNLFTFPVDEERTAFRYHHIFRDFLRGRLEREGGEEARQLRKRAAAVLGRAGAWAEALAVRAEEGNVKATLDLVEKAGEDLLRSGQYDLIRRTLSRLPKNLLDERPAALLVLGRATEIPGRWEEAEAIYRRALRACPPGARRVELMSLLAQIRLRRGDNRGCMSLCEKAMDQPGAKPAPVRLRILGMLGISACELGRLDEGERVLRRARTVSRRGGGRAAEDRMFYLLPGNIHYRRGEFRRAKEAVREALVSFRKGKDYRQVCHSLGVLAHITAETAETGAAGELAREGLRMAESLEYPVMEGYCRLALAKCALIDGDPAEARVWAEAALGLGDLLGEIGLRTISMTRLAETALASGNRREALRLARAALDVSVRLKDIYQESENCVLLGILEAQTKRGNAATWWRRAERIIRRVGMRYHLHRLLLIRLAAGAVPEKATGRVLRELLRGAESMEHSFLFLALEPERAVPVLIEAVRRGIETDYAAELLAEIGERAVPSLVVLLESPDEKISVRAVDLLARIGGEDARAALARQGNEETATGKAAGERAEEMDSLPDVPLSIRALGPLQVKIGKRSLSLDDWKSARALRLFQLLLVHRFRWVPRDVVIETLWPDADPSKGTNNLRQTIHLLRKILEPARRGARDSRYVRFYNEAVRLEPGEGCSYDADEFQEAVREAENGWGAGDKRKSEAGYRKALEIYRGEFLADAPFEEFAAEERERLRDRLIRATGRLLSLFAEEKRWEEVVPLCRSGIAQDPYREEFHYHLVQAHHRLGNRREALDDYHRYEETMVRELDLLPSGRMKALADKVVSFEPEEETA